MTEIYGLLLLRLPWLQSTLTKWGIFLSEASLSLLIMTLTGTHEVSGLQIVTHKQSTSLPDED